MHGPILNGNKIANSAEHRKKQEEKNVLLHFHVKDDLFGEEQLTDLLYSLCLMCLLQVHM